MVSSTKESTTLSNGALRTSTRSLRLLLDGLVACRLASFLAVSAILQRRCPETAGRNGPCVRVQSSCEQDARAGSRLASARRELSGGEAPQGDAQRKVERSRRGAACLVQQSPRKRRGPCWPSQVECRALCPATRLLVSSAAQARHPALCRALSPMPSSARRPEKRLDLRSRRFQLSRAANTSTMSKLVDDAHVRPR